jgi:fucose permease
VLPAGAFYLGYGVAHVPSTFLTMKLGARWWYGGMTVAWGIVATAAAAITNRTGLVVQRLFLGITEAGTPNTLHSLQTSTSAAPA